MKVVKALVLALAVSVCAHAGVMDNGVTGTPQPTPAPAVQGPTTDGEMDTGATAPTAEGIIQNGAAITFAQVILNLLTLS